MYGCSKSFQILITDWTHQKINYSFFFQSTFLQQLCTLPSGETACSTPQPRFIWVCLQQPSWTLDTHRWRSETGYLQLFSSLLEIGRSRRETGLANTVGAAAAAPRHHRQSQLLLFPCKHWHYHDEEKGHGVASLGGASTKLRRPSRQWCTYQSAVTVRLSSRGMMATWLDFPKRQPFSSVRCVMCWVFGEGTRPETARPLTASWFPDHIDRPKFRHVFSQVNFERPLVNFRNMNSHHSTLSRRCSSVNEWGILPANRFLTRRWSWNMDMVAAVPMLRLCWISRVATLGLTLTNYSAASMFATVTEVETPPASSKFTKPEKIWVLHKAFLPKSWFKFSKRFSWWTSFI